MAKKKKAAKKKASKAEIPAQALARGVTVDCVKALVTIMRDPFASHTERRKAAEVLLDRGWGKPQQSMEFSGKVGVSSWFDLAGRGE